MAAWLVLTLAACDRPFVAPTPPEIEVLAPELDQLFTDSVATIKVRATSFRTIAGLELDGRPMVFDPIDETWTDTVALALGINSFRVTALDEAGVEGEEELSLLRMRFTFTNDAPPIPQPFRLGEHTATLLNDGRLLLTGGVPDFVEPALNTAFVLPAGGTAFERLNSRMIRGRNGHTAGLLPDGRVLILGGAIRGVPAERRLLASEVELFDPSTNQFRPVPYVGDPIERVYHVMFITTDSRSVIVDIQGGLGENASNPNSELQPQRSFQSFRFERDTLFAFGAGTIGVDDVRQIHGHSAVPLDNVTSSGLARYLVTGTDFSTNQIQSANYTIDFRQTPLEIAPAVPFATGRFRHASALLQPGIAFTFGGRIQSGGPVLTSGEVYVADLDQFFLFDYPSNAQRRHGHTATKLPGGRILLIGGFSGNGSALSTTEFFSPGFGF